MKTPEDQSASSPIASPGKKPYAKPILQVYGSVRDMTASVAAGASLDGMSGAGMDMS